MRKFLVFWVGFLVVTLGFTAEVSQRKEIAVMPVYSSYNLPSSAYMYFDDRMIATIASMKRFQVIGYQYRLDGTTAERFIARIRELKKRAVLENPQYKDEDLGIAVIPASEMARLVNSVFVFVPSINGYDAKSYNVEVKKEKKGGGYEIKIEREFYASVNVSIKIIDTEGNLLSTYEASGESRSRRSADAAYQEAVNSAVGGLAYYLRNVDAFKIKTGVLRVDGDYAYLELGNNMGIRPGYEFALEEEVQIMDRFKEKRRTGLIRVSYVSDEYSYGHVIFGSPKPGDQLVEAPKTGGRFGLGVVAMPLGVPSQVVLTYPGVSELSNRTLSLGSVEGFAPTVFMSADLELGYSWLWESSVGFGIASPFVIDVNAGLAYEWYMRRMSVVLGGKFVLSLASYGLGNVGQGSGSLVIDGKELTTPVSASLNWLDLALQPEVSWNLQFTQTVKMRVFGGYHWSFYQSTTLSFEESGSENAKSASVTPAFRDWDGKIQTSGVVAGIEFLFRI